MSATRILIVDDDRTILSSFKRGLAKAGYDASTAESGQAAIELCRNAPPDLVLLDIRMPRMSGMEVADWLRAECDVPFVFLSAYDDADTVKEAAQRGALGYLVKPVDIPQVAAAIEAALARAAEFYDMAAQKAGLTNALSKRQIVSTAVGLIMERHNLDQRRAFTVLRNLARSRRRKLIDVATEMLQATETLNPKTPRA